MKVKKEQLNFLSRFVEVSDTRSPLHDKINIEVQGKTAYFSLQTDSVIVTTDIEIEDSKEDFSVFLPVKSLNSLMKTISDGTEVEINKNTISFQGASYILEAMDEAVPLLKQIMKYKESSGDPVVFKNLKEFKVVEGFNGIDDSTKNSFWESIVFMDGKYVAASPLSMAVVDTENKSLDRVNFPHIVARLFSSLVVDEISVSFHETKWMSFTVDNVLYFIPEKRSSIPNLDKWYSTLKIPVNVKIDRSLLKSVLSRMSLVIMDKSQKVISLSFKDGKAIFGSVQNPSSEAVDAEYGEGVEGQRVVFSFESFNSMYSTLSGDTLCIGLKTDESKKKNIFVTDERNTLEGFILLMDDSRISGGNN